MALSDLMGDLLKNAGRIVKAQIDLHGRDMSEMVNFVLIQGNH